MSGIETVLYRVAKAKARIAHKGKTHSLLYTLGCCLQDIESRVLQEVNNKKTGEKE